MKIIKAKDIKKKFESPAGIVNALKGVSFEIETGQITCLIGPDGAGKTTLLRIMSGIMSFSSGELEIDSRTVTASSRMKDTAFIQHITGYMPQRFGLYEDLTVQENLDLYTGLYGVAPSESRSRQKELLRLTGLSGFESRQAGKLSGGMKQKLALCTSLLRIPKILLLDEPTVGVDPLSRRELWHIIKEMVRGNDIAVVVSTAYMDEAALAGKVIMLHEGEIVAAETPQHLADKASGLVYYVPSGKKDVHELIYDISAEHNTQDIVPEGGGVHFISHDATVLKANLEGIVSSTPTPEDGFMLHMARLESYGGYPEKKDTSQEIVIKARGLVKKYGDFTAVNSTSFDVYKGEIFGLLGPNGAGKTTTFRMMCGLIKPTSGELEVAGIDARKASIEVRKNLGYMAQKFSLYPELSVIENMEFFASLYGFSGNEKKLRIQRAIHEFMLEDVLGKRTSFLPGGFKQRLSMAVSLIHKPRILFLDEPTSGADPIARRDFWRRIMDIAYAGTSVIVTTHFMEEAEYCDRIMIQDAGTMLASGTPLQIKKMAADAENMQEAFIRIIQKSRKERGINYEQA